MPWSPEQQQLLDHEDFVSELIKRRTSPVAPAASKPLWLRFLETSGGTALITVIIGGLVGSIITAQIQDRNKDREFQRGWLDARGNQALVAYREYLQGEQETVKQAYDLVGSAIAASEDVIAITEKAFDPNRYSGKYQQEIKKQRDDIRRSFTKRDEEWRDQAQGLGFLMGYYHNDNPEVRAAWNSAQAGVSALMGCGRSWYSNHSQKSVEQIAVAEACKPQEAAVRDALENLAAKLEKTRHYAWEGWESPDKMKATLSLK